MNVIDEVLTKAQAMAAAGDPETMKYLDQYRIAGIRTMMSALGILGSDGVVELANTCVPFVAVAATVAARAAPSPEVTLQVMALAVTQMVSLSMISQSYLLLVLGILVQADLLRVVEKSPE